MTADRRAAIVATTTGLAAAWIAFCVLVWLYGDSPRAVGAELLAGTWGSAFGAGQVLFKATPLLLSGVAFDLALRAGLFNIGAEGQIAVAGLVAAAVGAALPVGMPAPLAMPIVLAAAAAAGALWAAPPAILRARFGAHEVVSTIMMNRIADAAIGLALASGLAVGGSVRTADVVPGARIPRLSVLVPPFAGSAASFALVLAVIVAFAARAALARTRVGREIVLVGMNPVACVAEKIRVRTRIAEAMLASGAVAGLASAGTVLGYKGYYESGLGAGAGFGGLAVALLGRGDPLGLVLASLLFGTLAHGGLVISARVPMDIVEILEAVVVAAVALGDARVRGAIARALPSRAKKKAAA